MFFGIVKLRERVNELEERLDRLPVAETPEVSGCLGMEQDPEYAEIARMRAGSPPNDAKPTPAKRPGRAPARPEPASGQKTLF